MPKTAFTQAYNADAIELSLVGRPLDEVTYTQDLLVNFLEIFCQSRLSKLFHFITESKLNLQLWTCQDKDCSNLLENIFSDESFDCRHFFGNVDNVFDTFGRFFVAR